MMTRDQIEQTIITSILYAPDSLPAVRYYLKPDLFSNPTFKKAVGEFYACLDSGDPIDALTLSIRNNLSQGELIEVLTTSTEHGSLPMLTRRLIEFEVEGMFREMALKQTKQFDAFNLLTDIGKLQDSALSLLESPRKRSKKDLIEGYVNHLERLLDGRHDKIPTGIFTLDRMTCGGLELGGLTILGGTPGSGKTSLMLQIALGAASNGHKVGIIEGEMTEAEIMDRLNGICTGNAIEDIKNAGANWSETQKFLESFREMPLDLRVTDERSVDSLRALINESVRNGCKLIVIDYLQVFAPKKRQEDEFFEIKRVSETLRMIALRNNIHLLVATSLNRNEKWDNKPSLHSFYGSAQLGHDCSVGMLIHGAMKDDAELTTRQREVTLSVVKNRHGVRGDIELIFQLACQRFDEPNSDPNSVPF